MRVATNATLDSGETVWCFLKNNPYGIAIFVSYQQGSIGAKYCRIRWDM